MLLPSWAIARTFIRVSLQRAGLHNICLNKVTFQIVTCSNLRVRGGAGKDPVLLYLTAFWSAWTSRLHRSNSEEMCLRDNSEDQSHGILQRRWDGSEVFSAYFKAPEDVTWATMPQVAFFLWTPPCSLLSGLHHLCRFWLHLRCSLVDNIGLCSISL